MSFSGFCFNFLDFSWEMSQFTWKFSQFSWLLYKLCISTFLSIKSIFMKTHAIYLKISRFIWVFLIFLSLSTTLIKHFYEIPTSFSVNFHFLLITSKKSKSFYLKNVSTAATLISDPTLSPSFIEASWNSPIISHFIFIIPIIIS